MAKELKSKPTRVNEKRARPSATKTFPIVGVGASAGGLEAFTQLLQHLPVDTGMAFVLVQHLDPDHESALTGLLARTTAMPVREVINDLLVEPNHVYVIPPNAEMALKGGKLKLLPRTETRGAHRSIDAFLESLAQDRHDQAIGVILSGTASDGTLGLEAIKAESGITFAQDESAKYDSMPRSAIAAGCVDFVLSPEKIAGELTRIAGHPYLNRARLPTSAAPPQGAPQEPEAASSQETAHKKILLLLRNHSGVDFSLYKPMTIERRITRRMVLNKSESLEAYARFLRGNTPELELLYSDLLISVTSFFRNPEAFETLKRQVFPKLLQSRGEDPVRFWVLGCSTGQEAYSLAMAYLEFSENISRAPKLQIFATDLNEAMLEKARRAFYPKALLQDVSPERLRRFFVAEEGGYHLNKSLREVCIFARQNFLTDPPFSRMDLVSCRNLLIYIQPGLQQKILPAFHYALKPEGFLFLGASESIGPFTDLFEPVDKKLKIFSRKSGATPGFRLPLARGYPADRKETPSGKALLPGPGTEVNAQREADRLALARFVPPGVLVNASLQVLQFRGPTAPFLEPPTGKASFELLKMAHRDLLLPLRVAFNKAKKQDQVVQAENVRVGTHTVNLEVMPLKNLKERCYLVFFEETPAQKAGHALPIAAPAQKLGRKAESRRMTELARELAETRDYLQSLQEQYEAANEELHASNEEVTSANEELQSINEELETSKEELESTNEELTTVNEEMANRNQELNRLNSDLNNLHASIKTPILLLGRDLTIRRFTSQAEKLFNLLATDVGRPLGGIKHNFDFPDLEQFITEVIGTVSVREREVQDKEGHWYVLRARPYLTLDNKIDGAVLMLIDINVLKQHEQEISSARDFAQAIIEAVPPLLMLDSALHVQSANESFYRAFGVNPRQTEHRLIFELGNGQWNIPALRKLLEEILPQKRTIYNFEVSHSFENIGQRTLLLNARQIDHLQTIILSFSDITERKRAEEAQARLAAIVESSDDAIISKTLDGTVTSWNAGAERLFGYRADEILGQAITPIIPPELQAEETTILERLCSNRRVAHYETVRLARDGRRIPVSLSISPIYNAAGAIIGASKIVRDITERKEAEEALRKQFEELEALYKYAPAALFVLDRGLRFLRANEQLAEMNGRPLEAHLGHTLYEILPAPMIEELRQVWAPVFEKGEPVLNVVVRGETSKLPGVERHWLANYFPLRSLTGEVMAMAGAIAEITEQKKLELELVKAKVELEGYAMELERRVAERTAKLEKTIGELEHFSYAMMHDMRAPLRAMQGFGGMLLDQCADCLHPARRDMIRRIADSAGRMDNLVTDSLQYSKVIREELDVRPVDAAALLRGMIESYPQFQPPKTEVRIEGNIPRVLGNEAGLTQCFSNLMDNAVKFVHPDTVPKVRVWAEEVERTEVRDQKSEVAQYVRIWFEDNGIGIAKEHHDQIFIMFQQLSKSYEGTGIGLALVRKIVERMKGQVGVESEEGKGSRFWIELKRSD